MQPPRREPRIGVYVGEGASHSWTWFVDLLERYAYRRVHLLSEEDFTGKSRDLEVMLVSGGDTFAVARALGGEGAEALGAFLERGGLYIGSCAGAYLPLHSSKEPLNRFNFVRSRINNLTRDLPPALRMPLKYANRYGCEYIFHPVREEVRVRMADGLPDWGGRAIRVPLYGGPPLRASGDIRPLAFYEGFTDRTLFLTERRVAKEVYLGQLAACEKRFGEGRMVLLGPHFEHPWFPEGNEIVHRWIDRYGRAAPAPEADRPFAGPAGIGATARTGLRREVSNMRIRAMGLARSAVHWRIGAKVYEPEKIAYLIDAMWRRLRRMPVVEGDPVRAPAAESLLTRARDTHGLLRELAERVREQRDSEAAAAELFGALKGLVAAFLEVYFEAAAAEEVDAGRPAAGAVGVSRRGDRGGGR